MLMRELAIAVPRNVMQSQLDKHAGDAVDLQATLG